MFLAILLITLCFTATLSYREWVKYKRLTPKETRRIFLYIRKLILTEEWQEAKKELLPFISQEVVSKEAKLLYMQVLRGTKEHEQGLKFAELAMNQEPEELLYRLEEAKILLEMGRFAPALHSFQIAEPILRTESDLLDYTLSYLKAGFPDQAWGYLEPLLTKSIRGNKWALAADIFLEKKEYARAISTYCEVIENGWNTHQVQTHLGHAHRLSGHFHEAEQIYRKILEKDSSDVSATLGLGACMEERGFHQKALLLYQAAKAWEKRDPRLLIQAASCALTLQKHDRAEEFYAEILNNHFVTPDLLIKYGFSLERQNKWHQTEITYKELITEFPADSRGYHLLARVFAAGFTSTLSAEEGLQVAMKALEMLPEPLSYEILSGAQARAGLFEEAYQTQEYLSSFDKEKTAKIRRSNLIKMLRRKLPLEMEHIPYETLSRVLVMH